MKMIPVVLVTAALLSGCASIPTGNIEAFSLATADVTDKIDAIISDYNQANVNDRLVIMAQSDRKYVKSDLDSIRDVIVRDSDEKGFALYRANNALGGYAKALSALASAGSHAELALAGVSLSESLKGMNKEYKALAETEKDIISDKSSGKISRVVAQIAAYYIDYKRGQALKEVIIAANPSIQLIGDVISDQLLKGVIEGRLYTVKGNELAGYFADYNAKVKQLSFLQKKKALDEIYAKYTVMESTAATIMQAQKAILSIMQAHGELADGLQNNRLNKKKIAIAVQNIKGVHKDFGNLEKLIKNCETEIIADDEKGIICKPAS